ANRSIRSRWQKRKATGPRSRFRICVSTSRCPPMPSMRLNPERAWAWIYALGLLGLLLFAAWQLAFRQPIHTDLLTLLPPDGKQSEVQAKAQDNIRQALNRQIIVLTGAADPATGLATAQRQAQQW